MNSAARLLDRQFDPAKQMPLSRDCVGRMITDGRTCAGELIVPDLEKAYSGLLIACLKADESSAFPTDIQSKQTKCSPHVK